MEKILESLTTLKEINDTYGLTNEKINAAIGDMNNAKVCIPIIGNFSTGKSALVNRLLGYNKRLLKEDITPETAIPTEIVYSGNHKDYVLVYDNSGNCEELSIETYIKKEFDAASVSRVRLVLSNDKLSRISDVMIVDMPGFESGYEVHNKAIDNYVSKSMAYMIAFAADDMILRQSVGNILKELCLHDMPICVVITKFDKRKHDFEETLDNLKKSIKRFIGDRDFDVCITSSAKGDVGDVERFLGKIQDRSGEIIANRYRAQTLSLVENTERYLKTTLKSIDLSESELKEEEDRLTAEIDELGNGFGEKKIAFEGEIQECIRAMTGDVEDALRGEEDALVAMLMNGQSINDRVNNIVRNAVTESINRRLIPLVERYIRNLEKLANDSSMGDVHIVFAFDAKKVKSDMIAPIVALISGALCLMPILGAIVAIILAIISKKKREEMKNQIRMKLNSELYPQVVSNVTNSLETGIKKQMMSINTEIENELNNQRAILEKAMKDVREKMQDETEKKEGLTAGINSTLAQLSDMKTNI